MPHGMSWFSFFPGHEWLAQKLHELGGDSLVGHTPPGTDHVYGALTVFLILVVLGLIVSASLKNPEKAIIPEDKLTVRTFAELFVGGIYDMMSSVMGPKKAKFFLPLIGTCGFFIFFSNAIGLIPGFVPPTDKINTTLACSIGIFLATHIYGAKENGAAYFKHFLGPKWFLAPLMLPIELVSHMVRPVSLAIRLMVNMFVDHLLVTIALGIFPVLLPVPIMVLGVLVVVVQTFVFCLLSTIYIGMAVEHHEEHH